MHCIYKGLASLLIAAMGLACQSCSEDVAGGGENVDLSPKGQLMVTVATHDVATRGMETFEEDAADNELIHTCVVAFVKEDGKVAEVVDLTSETGVVRKEFNVILNQGKYKAYAFANIDKDDLTELNFNKDEEFGAIDSKNFDVKTDEKTSSSLIPMSGYLYNIEVASNGTVTINETQKTEVTIPVTRMVGKLEFKFTNTTSDAITVTGITFLPTATGEVPLLPSDAISIGTMNPTGVTKNPELTINATGDKTTDSYVFYVREVKSDHPTGHFPLRIKYKKGESTTEETLTALLYDLTEIHRNDWIRVPIKLTDYKLKLDVDFYPPIGGFPPVSWEDKDNEYYVRFATGGWFSIDVFVDAADAENVVISNPTIEEKLSPETTVSFFRKNPTIDNVTGELIGDINSGLKSGDTAIVTLEVTVTENSVETKFTRKIHFIYK